MPFDYFYILETSILNSLQKGILIGSPIINTRVTIMEGKFAQKRTNEIVIEKAISELIKNLLVKANPIIFEPIMDLEISIPSDLLSSVINNIASSRRGFIENISEENSRFGSKFSERNIVKATVPLSETLGYATYIRSISQVYFILFYFILFYFILFYFILSLLIIYILG